MLIINNLKIYLSFPFRRIVESGKFEMTGLNHFPILLPYSIK